MTTEEPPPQLNKRGLNCAGFCVGFAVLALAITLTIGGVVGYLTSPRDADPVARLVYVTGRSVNLRAGPGTTYPVVGGVASGDSLTIIDEENGWLQADFGGGSTAWIHAALTGSRADATAARAKLEEDFGIRRSTSGTKVDREGGPSVAEPSVSQPEGTQPGLQEIPKDPERLEWSAGTFRTKDRRVFGPGDADAVKELADSLSSHPGFGVFVVRWRNVYPSGYSVRRKIEYDRSSRTVKDVSISSGSYYLYTSVRDKHIQLMADGGHDITGLKNHVGRPSFYNDSGKKVY